MAKLAICKKKITTIQIQPIQTNNKFLPLEEQTEDMNEHGDQEEIYPNDNTTTRQKKSVSVVDQNTYYRKPYQNKFQLHQK